MKKIIQSLCFVLLTCCAFFVASCGTEECVHTWNDGEVSVEATCGQEGVKTFTCTVCGENRTEPIEEVSHNYTKILKAPTCEETGYAASMCSECGNLTDIENIDKIGHDYKLIGLVVDHSEIDKCGEFKCTLCEKEKYDSITYRDINLPILCFDGDISEMTKENKVVLAVNYNDGTQQIECDCTLKWQGASSLSYEKKNYTMQLLKKDSDKKNKVELFEGWGKESKYCLKANYVDFSHARNVVSGKVYNDIVKSRDLEDEVASLYNGGVVDGFPIVIYINGSYQGLYTLNIPKDNWMLGMEDDEAGDDIVTKQAILMADQWSSAVRLEETVNSDYSSSCYELEYCSTEDTVGDAWVLESFNSMIEFINNNDGQDFINGIENYINLERTIDSMLYTWIIMAGDNTAKNILWVTYDGVHWNSSMYDMDATWGMFWDGKSYSDPTYIGHYYKGNVLWSKIYENFCDEVIKRYFELRTSALSTENVKEHFESFNEQIPTMLFEAEKEKWAEIPSIDTSSCAQIIEFMYKRFETMDKYFLDMLD